VPRQAFGAIAAGFVRLPPTARGAIVEHGAPSGGTMTKSDVQVQRDVIDELRFDPRVAPAEIGVAAKNGVVTISGQVESFAKKYAAARAAERVSGVHALADELTVALPSAFKRTDTDVAHSVLTALRWDIEVPDDMVTARVAVGWVWLEGAVDWQFQIAAAEHAVRNLAGVRGVTNLLQLKQRASAADVKECIENALRRNAELDSKQISVAATDGRVTLRGHVRSLAEREDVERAAWSAPGVTAVEDELLVGL
jgi:osmotically-inducible protein OsmY